MANAYKVLAQGQLPASVATLYTVPGGVAAIIKSIHLVNTTGGGVTASLAVNGTSGAHQILPPTTILAGGFAEYEGTIALASGDTLAGVGGAGSSITYTVSGDET